MSRKATLSNSAAMSIPSDADIMRQASLAFDNSNQSALLAGTAVQRLAYAIMAYHFTLAQRSDKPAALRGALESPEVMKDLRDKMTEHFIPALPEGDGDKSDKTETARVTRVSRVALLGRALTLAAIFARSHVGLTEFNLNSGTFTVPSKLLLGKDETAFGRLASSPHIMLDNRPILITAKNKNGDDTIQTVRASFNRVVAVNVAKKPRQQKEGAGSASLAKTLQEAVNILKQEAPEGEPTFTLDTLSDDERNAFEALHMRYLELMQRADAARAKAKANKPANGDKSKAA